MSGMGRREFVALVGGAAAWPLSASAQQPQRMRRIGVLDTPAGDDRRHRCPWRVYGGAAGIGLGRWP